MEPIENSVISFRHQQQAQPIPVPDDPEASVSASADDILDQYNFHWEPDYRLKFKKE
jgi:hypothetical protein